MRHLLLPFLILAIFLRKIHGSNHYCFEPKCSYRSQYIANANNYYFAASLTVLTPFFCSASSYCASCPGRWMIDELPSLRKVRQRFLLICLSAEKILGSLTEAIAGRGMGVTGIKPAHGVARRLLSEQGKSHMLISSVPIGNVGDVAVEKHSVTCPQNYKEHASGGLPRK
jgi:hypothetical protein